MSTLSVLFYRPSEIYKKSPRFYDFSSELQLKDNLPTSLISSFIRKVTAGNLYRLRQQGNKGDLNFLTNWSKTRLQRFVYKRVLVLSRPRRDFYRFLPGTCRHQRHKTGPDVLSNWALLGSRQYKQSVFFKFILKLNWWRTYISTTTFDYWKMCRIP